MRHILNTAAICVVLLTCTNLAAQESAIEPDQYTEVDAALARPTTDNLQNAISELEARLKKDSKCYEGLWRLSRAYVELLNIKTKGFIEERAEYQPLLSEFGKKAYDYGNAALEQRPSAPEALAATAQGYGYYSASFGILKAVFKGAAARRNSSATFSV